MARCWGQLHKTMGSLRSRTILHLHTSPRSSARNNPTHMRYLYPITTRLQYFHVIGNVANEGLSNENHAPTAYNLSQDFFKPTSAGISLLDSSPHTKSNQLDTHLDLSRLAEITHFYSNVTPVNVKFLNYLFHHQTFWNNSSILTSAMVPTSCYVNNSFGSNRMMHAGKCLPGSFNNQNRMSIMWYSTVGSGSSRQKNNDELGSDRASQETLDMVKHSLPPLVYQLFTGRHDYGLLHKNVVLESNLFGKNNNSVGVMSYALELLRLRLRVHIQYSGVFIKIKDISILTQDGTVRIHWCLKAVSQTKVFNFFKLFASEPGIVQGDLHNLEATSCFHIDRDGLVVRHSIREMIPATRES